MENALFPNSVVDFETLNQQLVDKLFIPLDSALRMFTGDGKFAVDLMTERGAEGALKFLLNKVMSKKGAGEVSLDTCIKLLTEAVCDSRSVESQDSRDFFLASSRIKAPSVRLTDRAWKNSVERALKSLDFHQCQNLFLVLRDTGFINKWLAAADDPKPFMPKDFRKALKRWMADHAVTPEEAIETADFVGVAEAEPVSGAVNVIIVDELFPPGQAGAEGALKTEWDKSESGEHKTQERVDWLCDALKADGFPVINVYRETAVKAATRTHPYELVEARQGDRHVQVAVCPVIGTGTFILRTSTDPLREVVTIAELRQDPTVFEARCYSPDQWLRSIRHYAYTPLESLATQLKTRIAWHDKKEQLTESLAAFYLDTEQLPLTGDHSIITHGPLAGMTTWSRAFTALNRGAIAGLEGKKTFLDVLEEAFGPGITGIKRHKKLDSGTLNLPVIHIQTIFLAAAEAIKASERKPSAIAGIPVIEIDRAFRLGRVEGVDGFAECPASVDDFLVAAGLATREAGVLTLKPPAAVEALLERVCDPGRPSGFSFK